MPRRAAGNESARRTAEEVRRLLSEYAPEAVTFLVGIMRDAEQKPELRMKAAESVLDRACGKATAAVTEQAVAPPATVLFEGVLEEWSR